MNEWLIAAAALTIGLFPCGFVCIRSKTLDRLVAMELAGLIAPVMIIFLAEGTDRPSLYDLALSLVFLSYPATLVFVHFLERWL